MDCLKAAAPVETVVQLVFDEGTVPGLREVIRALRQHGDARRAEICPPGAKLNMGDGSVVAVGYDRIGHAPPKDILTLAFTRRDSAAAEPEAQRLKQQSQLLQQVVANLSPDEEHWHVLPGPLTPKDNRKLALSSARLLNTTRQFRPPPPIPGPLKEPVVAPTTIANDVPQIPPPNVTAADRIRQRLAAQSDTNFRQSLVLRFDQGSETVLKVRVVA